VTNNLPKLISVAAGTQFNVTPIIFVAIIAIAAGIAAFFLLRKK
jgi:hypothetical protein